MANRTNEEKTLLSRLASGMLDGIVGNDKTYADGYKPVTVGKRIENGIPYSYRESAGNRFFNGKENEYIGGKMTKELCNTDDEKLEFLQKYGWLIDDAEVRSYSAKYKPGK